MFLFVSLNRGKIELILLLTVILWTVTGPLPVRGQGGDDPLQPPPVPAPTRLEASLRFSHLTIEDGLPDNHVEVIFQDSQGFMWFGTKDGLSRYDGYHFTNYQEPDNTAGKRILDILEDGQGRLWIAAGVDGIMLFDPRTEQFSPVQFNSALPVITLFEDSAGFIWLGSPTNGVSRYDPATEKLIPYLFDGEQETGSPDQAVWDMIEDEAGRLWLAASRALVKLDPQRGQFTFYVPPNDSGEIRSLYQDPNGHIWLHGSALHQFDPRSERFTTYSLPIQTNILSTLVDSQGKIWAATFDGLLQFDLQSRQFTRHFRYQPTNPDSLSENRLFSLYEDRAGLIWIGTDTTGLNRLNPRQSQFAHYRFEAENPDSPGAARVTSITGDESGALWLGVDMALYQVDLASGQINRYAPDRPPNPDPFGIMALHLDRAGFIWFGLDNALYRFDAASREFTRYEVENSNRPGPPNPIIAIYEDPTGVLWLGRRLSGLLRFDPAAGRFEPFSLTPASQGVRVVDNASVLYEAPNGEVWVAGRALGRFNPTRSETPPSVYSISYFEANALYQHRPDQLWIAAENGLYRFDSTTEIYSRYDGSEGLPSSQIMSILPDSQGNLWLGTSKGLTRFAPSASSGQAPSASPSSGSGESSGQVPGAETFRNYDVSDGLQGNKFSPGAAWQAPDGRMFFGGENGLTAFYPDQIADNPYQPPVRLTGARLFNELLTIGEGSLLTQALNYTEQLTFNHNQNILSFEFAALSYAAPHKNRYRYMLEGFEESWNEVRSERRFATYTNLPAGDYTLRVQGSNDSSLWSDREAVLRITILPPWWETTWFRAVALVGLAGLVYGGYRWRVHAVEQYSRQLETEVAARTRALQESEERFATVMNSFEAIVYVADMETYELLFVNEYTRGIFGVVEGQLCWQALQAGQTGPCEFCTNKFLVKNEIPTGIYTWEFQNTVTGQWLHIQDRAIRWVDGRLVRLEVATDITERKQAERELEESEKRFREMTELLPGAVVEMDAGFTITYVNKSGLELFGYSEADIEAGLNAMDLIRLEDRERATWRIASYFKGEDVPPTEYHLLKKDGARMPALLNAAPIRQEEEITGFRASITDLSKVKEAEKALRESEELYRQLVETAAEAIFVIDQSGLFKFANPRCVELSGYTYEELFKLPVIELIYSEDREFVSKRIRDRLAGDAAPYSYQHRIIDKNGNVMWVQTNSVGITWEGRPAGLVLVADITEVKKAERDLTVALDKARRLRGEAEAANRAKSAFLANMSHELRTPLNAIIGFAQIIARSQTLPVEQRQHLNIINRSGEHLLALINQVLELSKIEAGRLALKETVFDLPQLLAELEGMFRLRADDKRIRLIFERSPDVPRTIRTDEVKLRQVLINLLNNALKFTEEGRVTLRVAVSGIRNQELGIRNQELGVRGQELGVREGEKENEVVQGVEGLAESAEAGGRHISDDKDASSGGTVRVSLSDETSGGVDPVQHRRGMGTRHDEGVSPLFEDRQRFADGAGDATDHLPGTSLSSFGDSKPSDRSDTGSGPDAERLDAQSEEIGIRSQEPGIRSQGSGPRSEPETFPLIPNSQPLVPDSQSLIPITFSISDTGPGIAPEEMKHLFEAFGQTETGRQAWEGTGLGLPISQKFVQLLGGGEIKVESPARQTCGDKGGPGATFAFDIPVEGISSDTRDKASSVSSLLSEFEVRPVSLAPDQPAYRILIVDDDPTNRQLLREFLAPLGFALREAENGRQAIDIWQAFRPHLIWMDMRMPVLDGYQAAKIIKSKQSNLQNLNSKIIALTASSFEEEKAEILAAGCDDLLRKPFREAELFQMMSRHIGVRFIYETVDAVPSPGDANRQPLTPDMLAPLPSGQLAQLAEAVELSDVAMANKIIDDIRPAQPDLAETLSRLVNNFEYDALLATIKQAISAR